jgi:hypothetical protein
MATTNDKNKTNHNALSNQVGQWIEVAEEKVVRNLKRISYRAKTQLLSLMFHGAMRRRCEVLVCDSAALLGSCVFFMMIKNVALRESVAEVLAEFSIEKLVGLGVMADVLQSNLQKVVEHYPKQRDVCSLFKFTTNIFKSLGLLEQVAGKSLTLVLSKGAPESVASSAEATDASGKRELLLQQAQDFSKVAGDLTASHSAPHKAVIFYRPKQAAEGEFQNEEGVLCIPGYVDYWQMLMSEKARWTKLVHEGLVLLLPDIEKTKACTKDEANALSDIADDVKAQAKAWDLPETCKRADEVSAILQARAAFKFTFFGNDQRFA